MDDRQDLSDSPAGENRESTRDDAGCSMISNETHNNPVASKAMQPVEIETTTKVTAGTWSRLLPGVTSYLSRSLAWRHTLPSNCIK
jgi:hypothetical protein